VRRLVAFVLALILGGVILASAATLEVDGGVLQGFRLEAEVTVPGTAPLDSVTGLEDAFAAPSEPGTTEPLPTMTGP
jgi:hypothetical protein